MGVTANSVKLLFHAKQFGVKYNETLMLGRQQLFITDADARQLQNDFGIPAEDLSSNQFAESLFHGLGAKAVDSMDYSDFEKASIIHDLNRKIEEKFENKFSVIFDGGTLEHVFNFPVAIKNCMDMLSVGGHFISLTPSNNFCGHGFYQFSPELFFSIFNERHGFQIKLIMLGVEQSSNGKTDWFAVKSPEAMKKRVTIVNSFPTSLFIVAEKIDTTNLIELHPFQSDYSFLWTVHNSIVKNEALVKGESVWMHRYRKWTPEFIKKKVRGIFSRSDKQKYVEGLGVVNQDFFQKIEI